MFKIYFEDLEPGKTENIGTYDVSKEEIIEFASKYDPQPFHINEDIAKQSVFGSLCASGWHTCAMTMRVLVDHLMKQGLASQGSPGVDDIRWKRPVFPGDTLHVKGCVLEKRDSKSRPNLGLAKSRYQVFNQNDDLLMEMTTNVMVLKRGT